MIVPDTRIELRPTISEVGNSGRSIPGLPEIPFGWTEAEFQVAGRTFRLLVPFRPDSLLDSPEVLSANARDDYMPYWAYLWPASLQIAESILRSEWSKSTRVLELGCGLGLVGISALAAGYQVALTDYDEKAVTAARMNAGINGFPDADAFVLDWREPRISSYGVIVGCDVTYESRNHAPLLTLIDRMLDPDGFCWIADGGRNAAPAFVELARNCGFSVIIRDISGREVIDPGLNYVLLEIRRGRKAAICTL
jgi:SAM-dependent methyltransferase